MIDAPNAEELSASLLKIIPNFYQWMLLFKSIIFDIPTAINNINLSMNQIIIYNLHLPNIIIVNQI